MQVGLVYHPDYLNHHMGSQHPDGRPANPLCKRWNRSETHALVNLDITHDAEVWVSKAPAPSYSRGRSG